MSPSAEPTPDTEPVERFAATSGRLLGWTTLVVLAVVVVSLAFTARTVTGLQVALALAFFGVLVWATQLRPRATVYPGELVLHNALRDTHVPLARIDEVSVRRTLNVFVGEQRFVCIGIGQSLRRTVRGRSRGPSSLLGFDRIEDYTERSTPPMPDQADMDYDQFVESRLTALVADARRRGTAAAGAPAGEPRHVPAWPEIAALAGTGVAFALSLLL